MTKLPFNKPKLTGKELKYIEQSVLQGEISGEGPFGKKCEAFLENFLGNDCKVLLTPSCTAALEISALLLDLKEDDEVIIPSFTFVSTASAFALRGARPVFADIDPLTLNIAPAEIERLITKNTKAIVVVHYAGWPCEMDKIVAISKKYDIPLIEDAAHALGSTFRNQQIGTFGDFATFSFHETKNVTCGEGGALVINNPKYIERAYIIRDKGTNRRQFQKGDVAFYSWVDLGSSFVMSDVLSAFLLAQLENIEEINSKRKAIHSFYSEHLKPLKEKGLIDFPKYQGECNFSAHLFFILVKNQEIRTKLQYYLRENEIYAVFHYQPLNRSQYILKQWPKFQQTLPYCENISSRLLRLPLYNSLEIEDVKLICDKINNFFSN